MSSSFTGTVAVAYSILSVESWFKIEKLGFTNKDSIFCLFVYVQDSVGVFYLYYINKPL